MLAIVNFNHLWGCDQQEWCVVLHAVSPPIIVKIRSPKPIIRDLGKQGQVEIET